MFVERLPYSRHSLKRWRYESRQDGFASSTGQPQGISNYTVAVIIAFVIMTITVTVMYSIGPP